jgi:hypothetical protein
MLSTNADWVLLALVDWVLPAKAVAVAVDVAVAVNVDVELVALTWNLEGRQA